MGFAHLINALATAFLHGEAEADLLTERIQRVVPGNWRWVRPLVERYLERMSGRRPRHRDVVAFLRQDRGLLRAYGIHRHRLIVTEPLPPLPQMRPVAAAAAWNLPEITTESAVARWLSLDGNELAWFADLGGFAARLHAPSKARHYSYRILSKRSGNIRLIEAPKSRLKALQRKLLAEILEKIPAHPAAHGFVKGRSIKSFAAPHIGKFVVLKMDLRDFFPSFHAARIQTVYRILGYPEDVADLLAGLCCTAAPRELWKTLPYDENASQWREARNLYARTHLPQGAPTSPALANICCYRLDCRLAGLAKAADAEYTRYADDLAFSGDENFARRVERFSAHVAAIAMEEGCAVNFRKTRVMRQGVRQRLAGIVVNRHSNVTRGEFDRLKAILTNCVRRDPESQNRGAHSQWRQHLAGRVGFVEMVNPARGARLRKLLEKIQWR
jgi:hypothetical protein